MAATNFTPIQLYFSTTASAVPTAANLAQGELAINITDGKLYYEDNGGVVQVIATKGAGTIGGSTTQIQYNNAGALAGNAAMVFNNSTNVTTLTTLNLTSALGEIYGGTAQSAYAQGDILYSSATNTLAKLGIGAVNYILTSTGTVPQWVAPTSITVNTATNLAGGAAGSVPYQSGVATTTFLAIGAANRVMTSTGTAPQWVTSLTGLTGVSSSSITNTSLTSGRVVIASTAGLEADSANLTFDGTTLSSTGYSTTGLSTLVKTVKIGDSSFNGVAVFAAATPAKLYMGTGTVTDVTSAISATNAIGAIASLGITPIAATNTSVTYTNAATLYIAGAPSAGTNVTLTNPYSLYVAAGAAYFGGAVTVAGSLSLAAVTVTSLTDSGLTSGRVTYAGTGGLLQDSANLTFSGTALAVTGTLSATGNITAGNSGGNFEVVVGNASANYSSGVTLKGSSTNTNWEIGQNRLVSSALTFTPSTVGGGSTFTTSAMTLSSTGLVGVGTTPTAVIHSYSSGQGDGGGLKIQNGGAGGGTFAVWPTATVNGEGANKLVISGAVGNIMAIEGTSGNILLGAPGSNAASQRLTFSNATGGLGIGFGDVAGNYSNIFSAYSSGAQVLAAGLQGSTSADAYTSSYGLGSIYRNAIRLNTFSADGIQFFTDNTSTVVRGTAYTPTERGRFDISGNFMVNQIVATGKLSVTGTGSGNVGILAINATDVAGTFVWASQAFLAGQTAGQNFIHFIGAAASTRNAAYMGYKFSSAGSVNNLLTFGHFGVDNVFNINGGGNVSLYGATTTADGVGITFPATQSASTDANTIDDYEEGIWTPTLTTNGFSGTPTLSSSSGIYTKTGRVVTVRGALGFGSTFTYPSGYVVVGGLPFTPSTGFIGSFTGGHPGSGPMGGACAAFSGGIDAAPTTAATTSTAWTYTVTYFV